MATRRGSSTSTRTRAPRAVDEPAAVDDEEDGLDDDGLDDDGLDDDGLDDDEPDDDEPDDDEPDDEESKGGRSYKYVSEGAGAMLAVFLYPLLINLLNGGPAQMWGWVRAKFVNEPYGGGGVAGGPGTQTAQGHLAPTRSGYQPANPYITG